MFDQNFNRIPNPPTVRLHCTKTVRDVLTADVEFTETQLDQQALEQLGHRYRELDRADRHRVLETLVDEADPDYQFVDGESLGSSWEVSIDPMPLTVTAAGASSKAAALLADGEGDNLVAVPEGTPGAEAGDEPGEHFLAAIDLLRHLVVKYEQTTIDRS